MLFSGAHLENGPCLALRGKRLARSRNKKSSPVASNDELKSRAVLEVASVASCNTIQQDSSGVECMSLIEGLAEDQSF